MLFFSIDATYTEGYGRMVNDGIGKSCNCNVKIVFVNAKPHVCLFAGRQILAGEELRYDYGVPDLPWRKQVCIDILLAGIY